MEIKRKYFFLRQGWQVIAPIFGFANTLMLIYITLNLADHNVPLYIFAPLTAVTMILVLVYTGKLFRDKQQETDTNLVYFKSTEALRSAIVMYAALLSIMDHLDLGHTKEYESVKQRMNLLVDATEHKI